MGMEQGWGGVPGRGTGDAGAQGGGMEAMGSRKAAAPDSCHREAHPKGSKQYLLIGGDTSSSSMGSLGYGHLPVVPAWRQPHARRASSPSRLGGGGGGCGGGKRDTPRAR